ncbi:hypothetical protein [Nostoc sp.]
MSIILAINLFCELELGIGYSPCPMTAVAPLGVSPSGATASPMPHSLFPGLSIGNSGFLAQN